MDITTVQCIINILKYSWKKNIIFKSVYYKEIQWETEER